MQGPECRSVLWWPSYPSVSLFGGHRWESYIRMYLPFVLVIEQIKKFLFMTSVSASMMKIHYYMIIWRFMLNLLFRCLLRLLVVLWSSMSSRSWAPGPRRIRQFLNTKIYGGVSIEGMWYNHPLFLNEVWAGGWEMKFPFSPRRTRCWGYPRCFSISILQLYEYERSTRHRFTASLTLTLSHNIVTLALSHNIVTCRIVGFFRFDRC